MKKISTNIVKTVILFAYLITVISAGFYHSHDEDLNTQPISTGLHTHIFNQSTDNNEFDAHELHFNGQEYFDEDHILIVFSLKQYIPGICFVSENSDLKKTIISSARIIANDDNEKCSRDKYVLTEANLPPPLS